MGYLQKNNTPLTALISRNQPQNKPPAGVCSIAIAVFSFCRLNPQFLASDVDVLWCLDADSNRVRPDPCDHDFDVATNADDLFNAARKYEHVDLLVFVVRTGPASPSLACGVHQPSKSNPIGAGSE
jgi:hypothetical protein